MKTRDRWVFAAVLLVLLASAAAAQQQQGAGSAPKTVPTPRLADGKPDLTGVWGGGRGGGGGARQAEDDGSGNLSEVFPRGAAHPTR